MQAFCRMVQIPASVSVRLLIIPTELVRLKRIEPTIFSHDLCLTTAHVRTQDSFDSDRLQICFRREDPKQRFEHKNNSTEVEHRTSIMRTDQAIQANRVLQ